MDYWPAVLVNPGGGSVPTNQRSLGTAHSSTRRPNLTLSHSHGWTGSESGIYKAGNDCDASKLDFRRTEILGEGCADAMSADSSCSVPHRRRRSNKVGPRFASCRPQTGHAPRE